MPKSRVIELKYGYKVQDETIVLSFGSLKVHDVVRCGLKKGRVACLTLSQIDMKGDDMLIPIFFDDNVTNEPEWVPKSRLNDHLFGCLI